MSSRLVRIVLALTLVSALALVGCAAKPAANTETVPASEQPQAETTTSALPQVSSEDVKELKIEDKKVGSGAAAKSGDNVTVEYTGWLTDGTEFDSSKKAGVSFTFPLGAGQVIKGWDEGVVGMKVGGVRKLTIPSSMGYGEQGAGGVIPPNATLIFEVKLLKIN